MKINFSPVHGAMALDVSVFGDALTLNGEVLDFGPLPEGGVLPFGSIDNPWVLGDVVRRDGQVEVLLRLPLTATASEAARFPSPIVVTEDGAVELPT